MLRKTLMALAWTAGGLLGLCVVFYLVLVAINWRDVEPSAAALRMTDFHRNRPAVRDEDNAFIYAMGFDVGPGQSPFEMGAKRIEWLRRSEGKALDLAADPLGEPPDHKATRHPVIRAYFEACGPRGPDCNAAFEEANLKFDEWNGSEKWLLERYRAFLGLASWREFISSHAEAPLPSYSSVMDGQKVLLLHARIHAAKGDAAGVREMLGEDLRFWRRALESSYTLIGKMLATAAILRHFKLGAIIMRTLPPEHVGEATPAEWRVAITNDERSMRRCMTGEWIFTSGMIRDLDRELAAALTMNDSVAGKVISSLSGPFFQPQDTINRFAEYYSRAAELTEGVPLTEFEASTDRVTELSTVATREAYPPRSLYNIPGRMLVGYGADYGSYARRVGDVEGVRRAALAAVSLHAASVAPDAIPAALAASWLRNPYDGEAFAWDAADSAIVFRGLEAGERGEHRIH
jgi:hypothetical protein